MGVNVTLTCPAKTLSWMHCDLFPNVICGDSHLDEERQKQTGLQGNGEKLLSKQASKEQNASRKRKNVCRGLTQHCQGGIRVSQFSPMAPSPLMHTNSAPGRSSVISFNWDLTCGQSQNMNHDSGRKVKLSINTVWVFFIQYQWGTCLRQICAISYFIKYLNILK